VYTVLSVQKHTRAQRRDARQAPPLVVSVDDTTMQIHVWLFV